MARNLSPEQVEKAKRRLKQWRLDNPEKVRAQTKRYRLKNPEKVKESFRNWADKNVDRERARHAEYRKNNPDAQRRRDAERHANDPEGQRARCRSYYAANTAKRNEQAKTWRAANPDRVRSYCRNRRARLLAAEGTHTIADIRDILKAQNHGCAGCSKRLGSAYQIDHIVPLTKGGTNDRRNLQILCAYCNRSKKDADPAVFYRRMGKLI